MVDYGQNTTTNRQALIEVLDTISEQSGEVGPTGPQGPTGPAGANYESSITINISSAQIKSLGTTPSLLLAAPGANKYYDFEAIVEYTPNGIYDFGFSGPIIITRYSGSQTINISTDFSPYYGIIDLDLKFSSGNSAIAPTQSQVYFVSNKTTTGVTTGYQYDYNVNRPIVVNQPIYIRTLTPGFNPSGAGTGTFKIKLNYSTKTFG